MNAAREIIMKKEGHSASVSLPEWQRLVDLAESLFGWLPGGGYGKTIADTGF